MTTLIEAPVASETEVPVVSEEEARRREVLLRAVEVLDERGWRTGGSGMYDVPQNSFCILGAVAHAGNMSKDEIGKYGYIEPMRLVLGNSHYDSCPYDWNDDVATCKEQVQDVLRRLANGMKWEDAIVG